MPQLTSTEVSRPTSRIRHTFAGLALLWATAAAADTSLILTSGGENVARLFVGDHLEVGVAGAPAHQTLNLQLIDSDGVLIASSTVVTDAAGKVEPALFWLYTGVLGCDAGVFPNPDLYRFLDFGEAETRLDGRTLIVQAIDLDGVQTAQRELPIVAEPHELPYFSDSAGCLRLQFRDDEGVYLSVRHPNTTQPTRYFFLTGPEVLAIGDPIADVRDLAAPQTIYLAAGSPLVTTLVWEARDSSIGTFRGIYRSENSRLLHVFGSDVDAVPVWPGHFEGIMLTMDGCPTCNRP